MNCRELLYVKTIAETKSISEASKKLFIAQPSLSQALQKIEERVGIPLFSRHQSGMILTLAGEKYYKMANEVLNIYNDFTNEITHINDLKSGRINIGIAGFLASHILPKILPDFNRTYPNIEIYIYENDSSKLREALLNCTTDIAITHIHPLNKHKSIEYKLLAKDPFVLVTEKDHLIKEMAEISETSPYPLIDLSLLKEEKFIMLAKGKGIRKVNDIIFHNLAINPDIILTTKNFETARRLASQGFGLTIIPSRYMHIFPGKYEADYYFLKDAEYAFWETCISRNPNTYQSRVEEVFVDLVENYFKRQKPM